jgi:endonuclease-3
MNRAQRAALIQQRLKELYPEPVIPLDHEDPFTFLVAVVLSAQCTDKMVNRVTPKLFAAASTPKKMVRLGAENILTIIQPLGLAPRKSQALVGLSAQLIELHSGQVPQSFEALEALPGVGHKTASVVMSQIFDVPAFPVDTHIHRLAKRWRLSQGRNVVQTEKDLKRLFPKESWRDLHLQFIYYGREHCTARGCDGLSCEICQRLSGKARAEPT